MSLSRQTKKKVIDATLVEKYGPIWKLLWTHFLSIINPALTTLPSEIAFLPHDIFQNVTYYIHI